MRMLRAERGPGQNAQLIGGEVTLLSPDEHADALLVMRRHGRKPMSMSHGDFDYDYLRALVVGPDGEPRLPFVSFAGHFDSLMLGRRGIRRARSERDLNPFRERFCRDVPAPRARDRRAPLPGPQHDGDARQRRPGRRRGPRLPRHGLPDVLVPARGLHRQPEPLEGRRLPRAVGRRGVGGDRARRRRAPAARRLPVRRHALQPHRLRRARRHAVALGAVPRRPLARRHAGPRRVLPHVRRDGLRGAARRRAAGARDRGAAAVGTRGRGLRRRGSRGGRAACGRRGRPGR